MFVEFKICNCIERSKLIAMSKLFVALFIMLEISS